MKINRFVALAAVAVLVVGTMSAFALRTFAQTAPAAPAQDCAADQADDAAEAEGQDAAETEDAAAEAQDAECDDGQTDANDAATEAEAEGDADNGVADEQDPAPAGTPAITAEAAQQIAEANQNGATATRVQLEDEDGQLIYSVEFSGAADLTEVKVDALTGEVLAVETDTD